MKTTRPSRPAVSQCPSCRCAGASRRAARGRARRTAPAFSLAAGLALAVAAAAFAAQPRPAAPRPAAPRPSGTGTGAGAAPAPAAAPAARTSAQDIEDRLMLTLANRDMSGLLEYYFKQHNVPADKQAAIRGISATKKILDPATPAPERRKLVGAAVKGVPEFLKVAKETEALMQMAGVIVEHGVKAQLNEIEYFGETAVRQAELNDGAEAVMKILDKCIEECEAQQNTVLVGANPGPAALKQWQTLDDRANAAKWTKAFSAYGLALSLDPASPRRKEVVTAAIQYLAEYENPEYKREAPVKVQIGKLLMAAGSHDAATKKFAEALKVQGADKLNQYDARFYNALNNLLAKKAQATEAALADLNTWLKGNLSPAELKEVSSGVGLLEYRLNELKASLAKDPAEKRKFGEAAEAVLNRIMKEDPRLEPRIKKMLLENLAPDADLAKLDTILLRSLTARGVDEFIRAKDGQADARGKPVLERAIAACREIQKRKGQPNVTEDILDEAAFLDAMFTGKLEKPLEAVDLSLHYLKEHGKNPDRVQMALNNALAGVEVIRKDAELAAGERGQNLITNAWKLAVVAGRKEYSFAYGKRLFDLAKTPADFNAAAAALKKVPDTHPAVHLARFFELSALNRAIDEKGMPDATKKFLVEQIQKLSAEVNKRVDAQLATAPEDQKKRLRGLKVQSLLIAAELTEDELKNPQGTLDMLKGFEQTVEGLPGEDALLGAALHLRVNAFMALNRLSEAVVEVKKLVETNPAKSVRILYSMLTKMDEAYENARTDGNKAQMKQLSEAQASLIGPLIEQTKDEKIRNEYKSWQASLLLKAARNEDDANKRKAYLADAQKTFTDLLKLEAEGSPKHDTLRYRLALISFELADYKTVQSELGQLIAQGKLGRPDLTVPATDGTGADTVKPNPVYWEGLLRYMQANFELAKSDQSPEMKAAIENNRDVLKAMYINRGKNVGGDKFAAEFQALKAKLLPGFDESKIQTTQPTTTKPAGAAASPAPAPANAGTPVTPTEPGK